MHLPIYSKSPVPKICRRARCTIENCSAEEEQTLEAEVDEVFLEVTVWMTVTKSHSDCIHTIYSMLYIYTALYTPLSASSIYT